MQRPSKKLLSHWYAKAKKAGFQEAEANDSQERLNRWESFYYQARFTPEQFAARQDYYRLATELHNDCEFETGAHKKIWGFHSEGLTVREIAAKVKKSRFIVQSVIERYRRNFCR